MFAKKKSGRGGSAASSTTRSDMDFEGPKMDMKSIMKDIAFVGSSYMTWKERKELENKKVVALGGKSSRFKSVPLTQPPKKQRLPLSVARVIMKKQKEREQKMQEENLVLGRFGARFVGHGSKKVAEKRKPEDKVLKSTVGDFRNGVLDVKRLLKSSAPTGESDHSTDVFNKGKKKKGGKNNRGKKGGAAKKRR